MIALTALGGAPAAAADWAPGLGLLQGKDGPLGDLLGYVVVFMVVVWPIIRGVMESAQQKRQDFERAQARRTKAQSRTTAARGRRTLEEIMRGDPYVEALDEDAQELTLEELQEDVRARTTQATQGSRIPTTEVSPNALGSAPKSRLEGANPELRPSERELVGDPFDDSIMGQDLVSHADLVEVPTEDELETSLDSGEPARASYGAVKPQGSASNESSLGHSESALARLEGRLSPWQRAFVYKEVLGPPAAMKSHDYAGN